MIESRLQIDDDTLHSLACAALTPGLRSVLVHDAGAEDLKTMAAAWKAMLLALGEPVVETVILGSSEDDDHVWGLPTLSMDQETHDWTIGWRAGLLESPKGALRMVVIPDLSRLSLAAARAAVTLIESDLARVERGGKSHDWPTRLCWLAACDRRDLGRVSLHLLDRFALRMTVPRRGVDLVQAILDWLATGASSLPVDVMPEFDLASEWVARLRAAAARPPVALDDAALRGLLDPSISSRVGARREIALARFAGALTRLNGLTPSEAVAEALRLFGDPDMVKPAAPVPGPATAEGARPDSAPAATDGGAMPGGDMVSSGDAHPGVFPGSAEEQVAAAPLAAPADAALPAETPAAQREWTPLKPPARRSRRAANGRGDVVGVTQTESLHDLAVFETLMQALRYQKVRRSMLAKAGRVVPNRLLFSRTDLRCYRRAPVVEQMLLVLVDYTSLGTSDWLKPLVYYLAEAYVERMQVGIIRVGALETPGLLRADSLVARNLLDQRVYRWLNSTPGKSTPLAHGLALAYECLRGAMQHGRQAIDRAKLVVISDGRGNVPLENSQSNLFPTTVTGTRGVEDALLVAGEIRRLSAVQVVYLSPPTRFYPQLVVDLAQALGTTPIPIEQADEVETP